jgi:hypothetical protein
MASILLNQYLLDCILQCFAKQDTTYFARAKTINRIFDFLNKGGFIFMKVFIFAGSIGTRTSEAQCFDNFFIYCHFHKKG